MCKNQQHKDEEVALEEQEWYKKLTKPEEKTVAKLIFKDHNYYSKQDRKYRRIVRALKIILLLACFSNTVVLGLKTVIDIDRQILLGLILSAFTTFLTSVMSYFNYEAYWMRNIAKHIKLNSLRDKFLFEAAANKLDDEKLESYMKAMNDIKEDNMKYWEIKGKGKQEE